jgi:hypothetical protein
MAVSYLPESQPKVSALLQFRHLFVTEADDSAGV